MSDYIATAQVLVQPSLKGFNTALKNQLKASIRDFNNTTAAALTPIRIPVAAKNITKTQLNDTRVAAQKTASTLKPVQLSTSLAGVKGAASVSAAANRANASIIKTGTSARATSQSLGVMSKQTGILNSKMLGLGSASARLDSALLGLRTAIGSTAVIGLGAGALAAIALGKAIRSLIGITVAYERELNTFQAVTSASADEMERVAAAAKALGADITLPAVSAADAAVAMSELAKAGLSVQDAIDGARGVLQLATAANIGFSQAVELAASAINAFELSGKDAVKVADTLANAANAAQGSITDIGLAFTQSTAIAHQAGIGYQDTAAFLTLLARAGLKGSDAGTSLRTALIRLINPTAKAAAIIQELGVSIRDEAGNIRPDIFIQFANAMRGMSDEARDAKLAIIGGQDALRAFAILGRASTKDFLALRAELRQQGTAADVAAARTKGLGGAYQALQSTLETIGITIGQRVSPGLTDFVNSITATANALAQSQGIAAAFSGAMAGVGTALNAVGSVLSTAGPLLLGFTNAMSGFSSAAVSPIATVLAMAAALKILNLAMKSSIALAIQQRGVVLGSAFVAGWKAAVVAATEAKTKALPVFGYMAAGQRSLATSTKVLVGAMGALRTATAVAFTALGGWTTVVLAAAAAAFYLLTRESAAEKATRKFKDAVAELAKAQEAAVSASESLASAQRTVDTNQLAVGQANLARETAAAALANSDAAAGSVERRQLEINLAIATQDVTFATKEYSDALKVLSENQDAVHAASLRARDARTLELDSINDLIVAEAQRARIGSRRGVRGETGLEQERRARESIIETLDEEIAASKRSEDAAVRAHGKRLQLLRELVRTTEDVEDVEVDVIFDPKQTLRGLANRLSENFEEAGYSSAEAYERGLLIRLGLLIPKVSAFLRGPFTDAASRAAEDSGTTIGNLINEAAAAAIRQNEAITDAIQGTLSESAASASRSASFQRQLDIAIAGGASDRQVLALLRKQRAEAQRLVDAIEKEVRAAGRDIGTAQFKKLREERQQAAAELRAAAEAVRAQEEKIAAATETTVKAVGDAQRDRDEAAQKLFETLSGGRRASAIQKALARAELTDTLSDDIKFTKQLVAFFKNLQKTLRDRLQKIGASAAAIKQIMKAVNDTIFQLGLELDELKQEQKENLQNALMQKLDLKIQFFQVKGDIVGELKARRARLAAITRELSKLKNAGKKNTLAWWELKVQQAEEQKAINELTAQTKEKNKAQASLMFAFLQAQQGFAANLLGNLIGGGLTGGLVGNVSPVASPAAAQKGGGLPSWIGQKDPATATQAINTGLVEQGQISAGAKLGVSRGQGSTQTELLRAILQALNDIKRGAGFPGAQYQRRRQSAAMDTGGGGGTVAAA